MTFLALCFNEMHQQAWNIKFKNKTAMPFDITKASHEVSKLGVEEIHQPLQ